MSSQLLDAERGRFKLVAVGIGLTALSSIIYGLFVLSLLAVMLLLAMGRPDLAGSISVIQYNYANLILTIALLLGLVGPLICLAIPRRVGALIPLVIAVVFNITSFVLLMLQGRLPIWLEPINNAVPTLTFLAFTWFLFMLGRFLLHQEIKKLAIKTMVLFALTILSVLLLWADFAYEWNLAINNFKVGIAMLAAPILFSILTFLSYLRLQIVACIACANAARPQLQYATPVAPTPMPMAVPLSPESAPMPPESAPKD